MHTNPAQITSTDAPACRPPGCSGGAPRWSRSVRHRSPSPAICSRAQPTNRPGGPRSAESSACRRLKRDRGAAATAIAVVVAVALSPFSLFGRLAGPDPPDRRHRPSCSAASRAAAGRRSPWWRRSIVRPGTPPQRDHSLTPRAGWAVGARPPGTRFVEGRSEVAGAGHPGSCGVVPPPRDHVAAPSSASATR
jgi:hypothetical protein